MNAHRRLLEMTAGVVSAYVDNAAMPAAELPSLIREVHKALSIALSGEAAAGASPLTPAVPVKNSITPDRLICLENGQKFRSLKRHLRNAHGLSPVEYRVKWGLPDDYPMVAPSYAAERSTLAKQMGLGRGPRGSASTPTKRRQVK